jgi:hypothetical protein
MMTRRWTPVCCFLQLIILLILLPSPCDSFSVPIQPAFRCRATLSSTSALYNNILRDDDDDNDNNNDNEDRERVRVPRGGRGRGSRQYEEDRSIEEYYETKERPYYEEEEEDDEDYDEDYDDDDEDYYEDDNDIDDYDLKETQNDYDGDILIPNPILDQVDPEGAGERFGELVRDPIFWRDVILVVAVFNFCEYVAQVPYY